MAVAGRRLGLRAGELPLGCLLRSAVAALEEDGLPELHLPGLRIGCSGALGGIVAVFRLSHSLSKRPQRLLNLHGAFPPSVKLYSLR